MLEDTKAAGEVKALAEFWNVMREDSDRAVYGPRVSTPPIPPCQLLRAPQAPTQGSFVLHGKPGT